MIISLDDNPTPSDKKIYSVGKDGDSIMYTFDSEILTIQDKNTSVNLQCSNSR